MSVRDTWPPPPPAPPDVDPFQARLRPEVFGADGSRISSNILASNASCPVIDDCRWVTTNQFWSYDRASRKLYFPDGRVSRFDGSGRLIETHDRFGSESNNNIALDWKQPG